MAKESSKREVCEVKEKNSKLESEKLEAAARLICLTNENITLKKQVQDIKVF